jgi:hypothetical protein
VRWFRWLRDSGGGIPSPKENEYRITVNGNGKFRAEKCRNDSDEYGDRFSWIGIGSFHDTSQAACDDVQENLVREAAFKRATEAVVVLEHDSIMHSLHGRI